MFPTKNDTDALDPRLIKQALEAQKPVLLLSIGPSRADGLPGVEKIEMKAGTVLEGVLQRYLA